MTYVQPSLTDHFSAEGPKRILALDGGGVRGILSLGFLAEIEDLLRRRHGNSPDFRLCHYFDLIAGTSTGSIIAALLAQGNTVQKVIDLYLKLAGEVFAPRWWEFRYGLLRPRYQPEKLERFLQEILGSDCRIGDRDKLKTGLLVMCKRIDTGSPWPISNNPQGRYFEPNPKKPTIIANKDYELWKIVRASTAAPTFFKPQRVEIARPQTPEQAPKDALFVDGGVSPHNNPALQAYLLATLDGFRLRWPAGKDQLLIISVGTGRRPTDRTLTPIAAQQGITALQSLMDDCGSMVESLMQGMGHCLSTPRIIDPELGALSPHELTIAERFSYARYDVKLYRDKDNPPRDGQDDTPVINQVGLDDDLLMQMQKMDNAKPVKPLLELGRTAAKAKVNDNHFPACFDLPAANPSVATQPASVASARPNAMEGCRVYRQREGKQVIAIRLNLDLDAFRFRKWGGLQTAKCGDWLIERDGETYTVDGEVFARTYRQVGPATYIKQSNIWAKPAECDGVIKTREGETHYRQGDYLVWNDEAGLDGYAISKAKFETLYQLIGDD
jgi:predicted acylesterase/phospholipase RssA